LDHRVNFFFFAFLADLLSRAEADSADGSSAGFEVEAEAFFEVEAEAFFAFLYSSR
jgi:hypothetical protein